MARRLGDISDVAVLGRLRRAQGFLGRLLASLLATRMQPSPGDALPYRVRLVDGTCISSPGAVGAPFDPLAFARKRFRKGEGSPVTEAKRVFVCDDVGRAQPFRLIVLRKSAEATRLERQRIGKAAAKS